MPCAITSRTASCLMLYWFRCREVGHWFKTCAKVCLRPHSLQVSLKESHFSKERDWYCEAEYPGQHSLISGALEVATEALQRTISRPHDPLFYRGAGPGASCSLHAPVTLLFPSP